MRNNGLLWPQFGTLSRAGDICWWLLIKPIYRGAFREAMQRTWVYAAAAVSVHTHS